MKFQTIGWLSSTKGKISAVLVVGIVSAYLSWHVASGVFNQMLASVKEVSSPNARLELINNIFHSVIELQHRQRDLIVNNNPATRKALKEQSRILDLELDTLSSYVADDSVQIKRVASMKMLLDQRYRLLSQYIKLRTDVLDAQLLAYQLQSFSNLAASNNSIDSTVVTTEKKITTSLIPVVDSLHVAEVRRDQSFWRRLFSRQKPPKQAELQKFVSEELQVRIDTLSIAQRNGVIREMSDFIDSVKMLHVERNTRFIDQEIELVHASNGVMNQLFDMLHAVEKIELGKKNQSNRNASDAVSSGLGNLQVIISAFLFLTASLTLFTFFDLSRSGRYRKQLLAAKNEAEQLSQAKQRFMANLSHELRTPLQSIIGFSEQVRAQQQPDRRMLETIHQSSGHLLQIVNEVLDYSRITSGKFTIESRAFDMHTVLEEVTRVIEVQAQLKSLEFQHTLPDSLPPLIGDAFRLRQILFNVLGNAVKFTDQGSVALTVMHRTIEQHCEFTFQIADTGQGISSSDFARIFEDFQQGDAPHRRQGTGLGLSIVKELVTLQGGQVNIASEPGKGSTFTIQLTYEVDLAPKAPETNPLSSPEWPVARVIVIDDDLYIAELCRTILKKHDIPHAIYNDGLVFLEHEEDLSKSTLFIDIRMPTINGLELCKRVRQNPNNTPARIIALTAQTLPEEQERILAAGFDEILLKPFNERTFVTKSCVIRRKDEQRYDLSVMQQMAVGDNELFINNLTVFVTETRKDLEALKLCLKRSEKQNTVEIIHRIGGRVGQLGASDLMNQMRSFEQSLRMGGDLGDVGPAVEKSCVSVDNLMSEIESLAKTRRSQPV